MNDPGLPPTLRAALPEFAPGEVALVGAGPGDPSLLTARALHFLGQADVVLHDRLVDTAVLALAPAQARLEDVGKRAGQPSCSQTLIERRLINLARAGRRVLRLKGGDPFVFGRGGEELLALAAAGIRCHLVPGITAGIGGMACAGIPLTHRGSATGAILLTGSDGGGGLPPLDWQALADSGLPLVIYMGYRRRRAIAGRLLSAGARGDLPAAIVSAASGARQQVREMTLAALAQDRQPLPGDDPALLVIGDTVALRRALLPAISAHGAAAATASA